MFKNLRTRKYANAVKEAYDNLPMGICFFSRKGLPILCNHLMYHLANCLMGKDLQFLAEFEEALQDPAEGVKLVSEQRHVLQFEDGKVWHFERKNVENGFVQYAAYEITNMYDAKLRLEERKIELEAANRRMERIIRRVAETTRQQEILTAKMHVHNRMGRSVLELRSFLRKGCPEEEKEALLATWRETMDSLAGEVGADEVEPCAELVRIAKNSGLDVIIDGEMPENPDAAYMIVIAMRECVTNTIRHANGTELYAKISQKDGMVTAVFSDNGVKAEEKVSMGGGLTSLKKKIERAGGKFSLQTEPVFSVTVSIPEVLDEESEGV